jgi:abortive infection bacteriophage resistance protein
MKSYNKAPLTIHQQIELLLSRGLLIHNRIEAENLLSTVSYYRLRGYTYPYQKNHGNDHPFVEGVDLEWIEYIYEFDRKLRLLILDALERFEVAFRCQLILKLSVQNGAWWFEDPTLFKKSLSHCKDLSELERQIHRSSEPFIADHRKRYGTRSFPPAWKSFEAASFGLISKFFQNLKNSLEPKKEMCTFFGLGRGGFRYLESWLQHFTIVRNICAHHGRLWDRIIVQEPIYAPLLSQPWIPSFNDSRTRFATLSLLAWHNRQLTRSDYFRDSVITLINQYSKIPLERMGFPDNWCKTPLWNTQQRGKNG